jgi:NADH-quinone oxidoreductase subunit N
VTAFDAREFWFLAPEAMLAVTGLLLLVTSAWSRGGARGGPPSWLFPAATLAGLAAAAVLVWVEPVSPQPRLILGGAYAVDAFARAWKLLTLGGSLLVVLVSWRAVAPTEPRVGEYYALLSLAACGMLVMAAGNDLLTLWIGLELLALSSYILVGYFRRQRAAGEAALKYFVLGVLSSAILLYGISLLYGITGTLRLDELAQALPAAKASGSLAALGWLLLLAGLFFKVAAAPFHVWTPDVYVGAPTPVTTFLAVASKAASFALLVRVVRVGMPAETSEWQLVVAAVAVLSMVWGNLAALTQSNVKRLLAYSAIAHSGYVLVGVLAASTRGQAAVLFYLVAYAAFTAGAFAVVIALEEGRYVSQDCSDYRGLAQRAPGLAAAMLIFLLALTGIPPTAGFVGKLNLFAAAIEAGWTWVAVVGVVMSALSLYTYFRVVVFMYQMPEEAPDSPAGVARGRVGLGPAMAIVLIACLAATLLLGLLPGPVLFWAADAAPWGAP